MEQVRPLIIDRGEPLQLPMPDGVLVDAKEVSQLTGGIVSMDLDPVGVDAAATQGS
jgi:hypothetical protein